MTQPMPPEGRGPTLLCLLIVAVNLATLALLAGLLWEMAAPQPVPRPFRPRAVQPLPPRPKVRQTLWHEPEPTEPEPNPPGPGE